MVIKMKIKLDGDEFKISNWIVVPVYIWVISVSMAIISHLCDIDVISINKSVVLASWLFITISVMYVRLIVLDEE